MAFCIMALLQNAAKEWKYSGSFSEHCYISNHISKCRYIIQLHLPFYAFYGCIWIPFILLKLKIYY